MIQRVFNSVLNAMFSTCVMYFCSAGVFLTCALLKHPEVPLATCVFGGGFLAFIVHHWSNKTQ